MLIQQEVGRFLELSCIFTSSSVILQSSYLSFFFIQFCFNSVNFINT